MKKFLSLLFALSAFLAQGQSIRRIVIAPPSGSSGAYEVRVPRNLDKYPLTTSGTSSFTAALASGAFSLTTTGGCIIASGTPPPLTAPTCTPTNTLPVVATNSGLNSRYSYSSGNGGTLQIRAAGASSAQLKIETVSGQQLTLSNAQNSSIPYNTFVSYGPSGDSSYPYDWTFWGVPSVPLRISMKTTGSADAVTFTPVTGAGQAFTSPTSTTTTPPVTDPVPTFASAFRYSHNGATLTVEIDGSVGDLSFNTVPATTTSWGNPDNITINAGQFYGYGEHLENAPFSKRWQVNLPAGAPYSLTARQAGNTSNTFTKTLTPQSGASNVVFVGSTTPTTSTTTTPTTTTTTTGSGSVDAQGFLVYDDQGWSGADEKVIQNAQMEMRFKKSVGACPTYAAQRSNNRNLICDQQVRPNGVLISDKGVQWQVSPYAFPSANMPLTIGNRTVGGTGVNPVQGGSAADYYQPGIVEKSAIIQTADRGPVACFRVRGLLWDWFSVAGNMPLDIEWWFKPNKVIAYKVRLAIEEWPSGWSGERKYQALSQELLCLYNIASLNNHIGRINGNEFSFRQGVSIDTQSNDYFTSECFAATYTPDRSEGVLYYTPRNSIFKSWQKKAEQGEWADAAGAYINASPKRTYDIAGTQTIDNGYIILGSQSEAMSAMAGLEPIDQSYDFDFTSLNNHWWNEDARVMRNSNGTLRWYCGDEKNDNGLHTFGRFNSPARAWQASQFQNVEFDMAVNGVNRLLLKWAKPGHFGQFEYTKEVVVIGDGTRRTYQFQLAGMENWNGTITYLGLQAIVPSTPSAYVDMYRARKF